jgi:hypothetical protein
MSASLFLLPEFFFALLGSVADHGFLVEAEDFLYTSGMSIEEDYMYIGLFSCGSKIDLGVSVRSTD